MVPAPQEPVQPSGQFQQKAETLCESQNALSQLAAGKGQRKLKVFFGGVSLWPGLLSHPEACPACTARTSSGLPGLSTV